LGAGADVTIIDAQGYGDVVDARANNATISGFTLRNSGEFDLGHMNCGVYVFESDAPVIRDNVIVNNKLGIGVWYGANPDIRNNIIKYNSDGFYIYGSQEEPSNPRIINNTIANNQTNGITLRVMVSPVVVNNIIVGHITGINHNYVTGSPTLNYNNLWDNDANYLRDNGVDETLAGPGSVSVDPYFAEPGYWADVDDPNVVVEPNDPNAVWADGDYHLKSQAGRYNPSTPTWVVDGITSPCIDAGDPNSPVAFEPFPNGGTVNMGAYGGTAEASKSPFGFHAKYSGGTGEPNDPYQIATAEDLMLLGDSPEDYDKYFVLTGDIDLDPNLPGRRIFDTAVIVGSVSDQGISFTGTFDGNGHEVSRLTIAGSGYLGLFGELESGGKILDVGVNDVNVNGSGTGIGGLVGFIRHGSSVINCHSTGTIIGHYRVGGLVGQNDGDVLYSYSHGTVSGNSTVGGLVGNNNYGRIAGSFSTSDVSGYEAVGGLAGRNYDSITMSYSSGEVSGIKWVGGLVGANGRGNITASYSTGSVTGTTWVGGLVGSTRNTGSRVSDCYSTGLVSGSDNVGGLVGRANGNVTSSFWDIETSGQTTSDGGTGKTTAEMQTATTFLEAGWDFVDEIANGTEDIWWILEGQDYPRLWWELPVEYVVLVIDDFESYNYDGDPNEAIWYVWIDGYNIPENGAIVGCLWIGDWDCLRTVHSGEKAMPLEYHNSDPAYLSESKRTFDSAWDWTIDEADTLTLYFRGEANNSPEPLYVAIEDSAGQIAVVQHPNADAVLATEWQKWNIPFADLTTQGVNVAEVKKMYIGVGNRDNPQPGGIGRIYIDDIRLTERIL
jgi:parallel beta-helix repeat protein